MARDAQGLTVFVYSREGRSDAVRALKAAKIKYSSGDYIPRAEVDGSTPRYVIYDVSRAKYERFMAALDEIDAQGVEVYYE